jgi:hypothetical protein
VSERRPGKKKKRRRGAPKKREKRKDWERVKRGKEQRPPHHLCGCEKKKKERKKERIFPPSPAKVVLAKVGGKEKFRRKNPKIAKQFFSPNTRSHNPQPRTPHKHEEKKGEKKKKNSTTHTQNVERTCRLNLELV